ncbi:MAG: methionine ABC transporter permease [Proteobacteria bacterium]|nr:MAG: methionine ABC transporter permease [Pseudomonadota bacterium]
MSEFALRIYEKFMDEFPYAIWESLYMCLLSTTMAFFIGLALAILLVISGEKGLKPNKKLYTFLDFTTNTLRSFPFIILIVAIAPLTKLLVGTNIGTTATIVPLTIGAAPFIARLIEGAFKEVDAGLVEAAQSFGATNFQIIFKIILPEALPSLVSTITVTLIVIVGFSAMAGVVGGGGVGTVAINRGYNGFDNEVLYISVVVLLIMVQIFQSFGDFVYKLIKK